jgi:hypothetical protein
MEEGPTVVAEGDSVGGLKESNVVVDKAFEKVEELFPVGGLVERFEGGEVLAEEIWIGMVEHVVLQGVLRQAGEES